MLLLQAAFLSTFVGVDVAEVAARAAVTALSDFCDKKQPGTKVNHFLVIFFLSSICYICIIALNRVFGSSN